MPEYSPYTGKKGSEKTRILADFTEGRSLVDKKNKKF